MKKVVLSIVCVVLIVSALIIPCFASYYVPDDRIPYTPYLPYNENNVYFENLMNSSSAVGGMFTVNLLSRYRFCCYNGGDPTQNADIRYLYCSEYLENMFNDGGWVLNWIRNGDDVIIGYYILYSFTSTRYELYYYYPETDSTYHMDISRHSSDHPVYFYFYVYFDDIHFNSTHIYDINPDSITLIYASLLERTTYLDLNNLGLVPTPLSSTGQTGFTYCLYSASPIPSGSIYESRFYQDDYISRTFDSELIAFVLCLPSNSTFQLSGLLLNPVAVADPNEPISFVKVYNPPPSQTPDESDTPFMLLPTVYGIFLAPSILISSMLNFDIFGVNLYYVFLGILTALVIFLAVKFIIRVARFIG